MAKKQSNPSTPVPPEPIDPVQAPHAASGEMPVEAEPEIERAPNSGNPTRWQAFSIELKHTCGEGTIRPPFQVQIEFTPEVGERTQDFLDPVRPSLGVKIRLPLTSDAFEAGMIASAEAIKAFNRFYGIVSTEHQHKVSPV